MLVAIITYKICVTSFIYIYIYIYMFMISPFAEYHVPSSSDSLLIINRRLNRPIDFRAATILRFKFYNEITLADVT
jgi:hypothetical protein